MFNLFRKKTPPAPPLRCPRCGSNRVFVARDWWWPEPPPGEEPVTYWGECLTCPFSDELAAFRQQC